MAYVETAKWPETHWKRPDYDALLLKANTTVDAAERTKLYQEAGKMLADEGGAHPADVRPSGAGAAQGLQRLHAAGPELQPELRRHQLPIGG